MYYLFAFRSRANSMQFYDALKREDVPCAIVSTPREIALGCGLSVKVEPDYVEQARRIYNSKPIHTFTGLFRVCKNNGFQTDYTRI